MVAFIHAEIGEHDDAQRIADGLIAKWDGPVVPPPASTTLAYVAEVVTAAGDRDRAVRVYQLYRPYRSLATVSGLAAHCPGAVDRYLGQLAATLERWDDAQAHYEAALQLEAGLRSPPLLARTRYWYGRMLLERGRPVDATRAHDLLMLASETAERLGMARLAVQASALA